MPESLMSTLHPMQHDYRHHKDLLDVDVAVGVEIEYNNCIYSGRMLKPWWETKADGSLRDNGIEFVFSTPLKGENIYSALQQLFNLALGSFSADAETSMHVHLDCRKMEDWQLRNLILFSMVYEELLFVNNSRYASGFCKMVTNNFLYFEYIMHTCRHLEDGKLDAAETILKKLSRSRYFSFAVDSLIRFGSIEYRTFDAPTTLKEAIDNVNTILGFYQAAMCLPKSMREAKKMLLDEADQLVIMNFPSHIWKEYTRDRQYYQSNFEMRLFQAEEE